MSITRRIACLLALAAAAASCDSPSGPEFGPPAEVDAVSGDGQAGAAGAELGQPLVVRVTDERGRPVQGQTVSFVVTQGGGSVFAGSATTDADGQAGTRWTLGTVAADSQRVEARAVSATGQTLAFATFRADATPGGAASVAPVGPPSLTGIAGLPLLDSVAVRVTDAHGNPVPGAAVVWTVRTGGGSVSPGTSTADGDGVARALWSLGTLGGAQTLEAAAGVGVTTAFTANPGLPLGATLAKVSGDAQTGPATGAPLAQPVVVRVVRADGRPIPGVAVSWIPGPNSSVSHPSSVTDAGGYAQVTWSLAAPSGAKTLLAGISPAQQVAFGATGFRVGPTAVAIVSGGGQTGYVGAMLDQPVVVRVTDSDGAPMEGVHLQFAASGGGSAGNPARSTTDAQGLLEARWTLGPAPGPQTLTITTDNGTAATTSATAQPAPPPPPPPSPARHTSAGSRTTCAVNDAGELWCWGYNATSAVGDGTTTDRLSPVRVGAAHTWATVSVGAEHACAITRGGEAYCWGRGTYGALGITPAGSPPMTYSAVPARVEGGHQWISISAGRDMTCGITAAGRAYCWGANFQGKLGLGFGDDVHRYRPAPVTGGHTFFVVSTWEDDTCALTPAGDVYCWGYMRAGPEKVPGGILFQSVSVGDDRTCGISRDYGLYCWAPQFNPAPQAVQPATRFASVTVSTGEYPSTNDRHVCARTVAGATLCWGSNAYGQLGNGTLVSQPSPSPTGPDPGIEAQSLDAGGAHTCGFTADGRVYCWGLNNHGQLGTGDTYNRGSPVPTAPGP